MKAAISGAGGFIGSSLSRYLREKGYEVVPVSRRMLQGNAADLSAALAGATVVVHLSGAPMIQRWTNTHRRAIYDGRIVTTRNLVEAMGMMDDKPSVFICASGVGIYPGDGVFTEADTRVADDFLGEVCRDWEYEASQGNQHVRTLMLRFGVVLGREGGALSTMSLPFRLGLGGRIGHGRQMMSWVHIDDLLRAVYHLINKKTAFGPVNVTSPQPVSNRVFTRALAKALHRPAWFVIPALALKLLYGEGSIVVTQGQAALPEVLQSIGFQFRYPSIEDALAAVYKKR